MKIVAFSNTSGSKYWRLLNVSNYIQTRTDHDFFVFDTPEYTGDILDADIVIGQIWNDPESIRQVKARGARFIYEIDDLFLDVGEKHNLTKFSVKQRMLFEECLREADAITVTTPQLKSVYEQYNPNVYVLPNYFDFYWWGEPSDVRSVENEVRIGWCGGITHKEDLEMVIPALSEIMREMPFVKFVYCGYGGIDGTSLQSKVNEGEDIFASLPRNQREYFIGVTTDLWPVKSKTLGIDIGICPLVHDTFNLGKTPIKWMEYTANGIPVIASDHPVYTSVIQNGVNGLLAKDHEWVEKLKRLILNKDQGRLLAHQAMKDLITKHDLEDHYQKWVAVYQDVLSKPRAT